MRRRRFLTAGLGVAACLAGCGRSAGKPPGSYEILPGGERWGRVADAFARAARAEGYKVGGPGPVTTLTVTGLPALAAAALNAAESPLDGATPLARLAGEVGVVLVPQDSRFATFDAFGAHLRAGPAGTPLAGGPQGSPDHLLFGLIARGLGADTRQVDYTGYPGTAEAAGALLAGRVAAAAGTLAGWRPYIDGGRVRVLAVSCAERFPGVDAPSLLECGVRVNFTSWSAAVGPGDMPETARAAAVGMCEEVTGSPGWRRTCEEGGWSVVPLAGELFAAWVAAEIRRTKTVLQDLGLLESGKGTT